MTRSVTAPSTTPPRSDYRCAARRGRRRAQVTRLRAALAAASVAMMMAITSPGAIAQEGIIPGEDPALRQTVSADEQIAPKGTAGVFTQGHADMGVRLDNGELGLLLRDDSKETPVWRYLDDLVIDVPGVTKQALPTDGTFDFIGAKPGQEVYVLPQTEQAGIPWLGWNTQDPNVVASVENGVTLELLGHQGPGKMSLFLQAGGFSKPDELWNTGKPFPQAMFVQLNTHAHANWVFTEKGTHIVAIGVRAKMIDGTEQAITRYLRFAVDVPAEEAATTQWEGDAPTVEDADDSGDANGSDNSTSGQDGSSTGDTSKQSSSAMMWVLGAVIVIALIVVVGGYLTMRSSQKARSEAGLDF